MPRLAKAIMLGLLTAWVGFLATMVPPLGRLEVELGLAWLFELRGSRAAPEEVVIVTIDRESSDWLGLPNEPDKWPRELHAHLVQRLVQEGAAVIAFDIIFDEPRDPVQDRLFAEAIRKAGNVVLFEYLKKHRKWVAIGGRQAEIEIEERVPPVPEFASAAVTLAPFPLPKVPARVSQAWLFKFGVPTLPVAALQVYARPYYGDLFRLLKEVTPEKIRWLKNDWRSVPSQPALIALARHLREWFQGDAQLPQSLLARLQSPEALSRFQGQSIVAALIRGLSQEESFFLDFYGPPHSIVTFPYYQLLKENGGAPLPVSFKGKAVFVGFSEQFQPEQKDGFYTVYSQPDGLDISGVEIAATAFANLLEQRSVTPLPLPLHYLIILLWGAGIGFFFLYLPIYALLPSAAVLGMGYMSVAHHLFTGNGLWLPVTAPLLWQLPLGLLGALFWRYLMMETVIKPYLPAWFWRWWKWHSESPPPQIANGICLATDVQQYTALAERFDLERLRPLLNRYFRSIFEPVKYRGGFIADIKGDAIMAIWADLISKEDIREQACLAALDIEKAVAEFNRCTPEAPLPTRIGLHYGKIVIGSVGSSEHLEYRAVGDVVNTASRIENLNKLLGTRVLVSHEVVVGLESIFTRELGEFCVKGRQQPLAIYELIGRAEEVKESLRRYCKQFDRALQVFQRRRWLEALEAFKALLARYGNDGPSLFYLQLSKYYARTPPPVSWNGIINLSNVEERHNFGQGR
ncbi:Adenylyl cyclase class-3/4/guanylyl cyclase [Nitrosococcus oceani ATCC 19707]|uniref:Adenylyl cyclase class-3/4/guanylyl cyclase n=2 Tax=Nitrosococcus oceani TaxID=1229 RepID=Q3JC76_NITOC|nr:adenylate/guanylate cyclase domain-containing protein [Nitrosococcus oceani]ABA57570.1 Adenylyl cyclase class-3/4/guanylyl cyclase [Nitrosococcus oceani ATCC 19707]EDZ67530.1 CHASE2 domain family [Nitrosococcus oceani AFC27]KFI20070.1 adenylyl cyclase [Nitrosococcus oceani C-27]GEM20641.1 adenylate/guanylate cyclase domain-containing protein [Nitrosococcus oceani]